jgi:hypothetical protein
MQSATHPASTGSLRRFGSLACTTLRPRVKRVG